MTADNQFLQATGDLVDEIIADRNIDPSADLDRIVELVRQWFWTIYNEREQDDE